MAPRLVSKRYFPVLVLVMVAAIAYLQARGSMRLLAALLQRSPDRVRAAQHAKEAPLEPNSGRQILERNPFAAQRGPLTTGEGDREPLADTSDPLSWPDCQGVHVLIVTESKDPWWSMTTLREPGAARARLRRVGDTVADKRVAFIGFNPRQGAPAVWLQGPSTVCQSMLFRRPTESVPAAPALAAAPAPLLRSLRVVPEQRDGRVVGLRLLGIRPSSLLGSLGLQNGDRLDSINGFSVASPEKALEAYARLRTASRLNVLLTRAGKPVELSLNIN